MNSERKCGQPFKKLMTLALFLNIWGEWRELSSGVVWSDSWHISWDNSSCPVKTDCMQARTTSCGQGGGSWKTGSDWTLNISRYVRCGVWRKEQYQDWRQGLWPEPLREWSCHNRCAEDSGRAILFFSITRAPPKTFSVLQKLHYVYIPIITAGLGKNIGLL